jgi:hypothetical protein
VGLPICLIAGLACSQAWHSCSAVFARRQAHRSTAANVLVDDIEAVRQQSVDDTANQMVIVFSLQLPFVFSLALYAVLNFELRSVDGSGTINTHMKHINIYIGIPLLCIEVLALLLLLVCVRALQFKQRYRNHTVRERPGCEPTPVNEYASAAAPYARTH